VEDQARRVRLRVAADDEDLLPQLRKRGQSVLRCGGLSDSTFAVECDLPKFSHRSLSLSQLVRFGFLKIATGLFLYIM
jgi:hypothetical protein